MEEKRKKRGVGRWIILGIVVWAVGSGTLAGRSWTTTEGEEFEADLVRYKNGIVILKKSEGGNTMLSLGKLSGADQEYVREKYPEGDRKEAERVTRQARPVPKPAPQSREAPPAMQRQPERRQPQGPTPYLKELNPGDLAPEVIGRLPKSGEKMELTKLKGTLVLIDFFRYRTKGHGRRCRP